MLRERIRRGECLLGTFVKSPSYQTVEILAGSGLDFIVIDAEHAPFALSQLDALVLAARANAIGCVVRVPAITDPTVGACLDMGADGVLLPHVTSGELARDAVRATRFRGGTRGFSPSPRGAGYGREPALEYLTRSDRELTVWAQVEDRAALSCLDEIARVPDLDCLFVGRMDLALSLDVDGPRHPQVYDAVRTITAVAQRTGLTVGIHFSDPAEVPALRKLGARVCVCASDQQWLRDAARAVRVQFDQCMQQ